jgi:hypothetical protein
MCDEIREIRAKIQVIDAGMDAVLCEIHESLSLGHDAKPLCSKLCPLVHVRAELIQRMSHLMQQILSLFPTSEPLPEAETVHHDPWQTRSWRSGPWPCLNSEALHCP